MSDFFKNFVASSEYMNFNPFLKKLKKRQSFVQISVFCSITALNLGRGSSFSQTRFVKPATTKKVDFLTRGPPWYIGSLALWDFTNAVFTHAEFQKNSRNIYL